jgi:hypothetical protein
MRLSLPSARFAILLLALSSCIPDLPNDGESLAAGGGGSGQGGDPSDGGQLGSGGSTSGGTAGSPAAEAGSGGEGLASEGAVAGSAGGSGVVSHGGFAGDEEPANLVDNPSFERADCAGWRWSDAMASTASLAHDGERACRICATREEDAVYGLEQSVSVERFEPRRTYVATAWVRAEADTERAVSSDLRVGLWLDSGPYTSPLDGNQQSVGALSTSWKSISKSLTYTPVESGTHVTFDIVNRAADYGCFLVDEVVLQAMP